MHALFTRLLGCLNVFAASEGMFLQPVSKHDMCCDLADLLRRREVGFVTMK